MQPQPAGQLLSTSSDASFDWSLVVDVSVPVGQADYKQSYPLPTSPLPGPWAVDIRREDDKLVFGVEHGKLEEGLLGRLRVVQLQLDWLDGIGSECVSVNTWFEADATDTPSENEDFYTGWEILLGPTRVKKASASLKEKHAKGEVMSFRLRFDISREKASSTKAELDLCRRKPHRSFQTPILPKVRLVFPRGEPDPVELWADAEFLKQSSPYFETLLNSGFSESIQVGSKRPRRSTSPRDVLAPSSTKDFDDSDDEVDRLTFEEGLPELYDTSKMSSFSYQRVVITSTAYSTYQAVLRFLESGYIHFAPLRSSYLASDSFGSSTPMSLASRLRTSAEADPHDLFPVSPKSTYRLAHLLELARLQRMCLAELAKQLTPTSASKELFDPAAVLYDEWRKVVLEYVVAHWAEVEATQSWKDMMERVKADEVPGAVAVVVELMQANMQRQQGASAGAGGGAAAS